MTMTTPGHACPHVDRHERIYRLLLVAYPRQFRNDYGEDLVQGFRDLMVYASDGRGVWWRTTKDLISNAVKERAHRGQRHGDHLGRVHPDQIGTRPSRSKPTSSHRTAISTTSAALVPGVISASRVTLMGRPRLGRRHVGVETYAAMVGGDPLEPVDRVVDVRDRPVGVLFVDVGLGRKIPHPPPDTATDADLDQPRP